mgnify:CR=1 FL=1
MSRALKQDDLVKLSKLYEAEFNKPDLHDRILVLDVVALQLEVVRDIDESETSEACSQCKDEDDAEPTKSLNEESGMNTRNEN